MAFNAGLTVVITTALGRVWRWGPEEWEAKNIPQGITFTTAMPGGFKMATINLPRRIDLEYPDLNLFDNVEILGAGNEVAWEGRVAQLPRSHDDTFSITVGCVGWSTHLTDDPTFREIYVSRDLSEWTEISSALRIAWGVALSYAGFSVAPDSSGLPSIELSVPGPWGATIPVANAMLDAGPSIRITAIDYDWVTNDANPTWNAGFWRAEDDAQAVGFSFTDLAGGLAGGSGTQGFNPARVIGAQAYYSNPSSGEAGKTSNFIFRRLAWFGNHGVTIRGERPNRGVYASDAIADAITRAAPLLNFTTGPGGTIQPTNFIIPQFTFHDPTTAEEVVMKGNAYHLWDWAVWENKTFYFNEPTGEAEWVARFSEGARLSLEGSQAQDQINGVFVRLSDPSGVSKTVGPPGSGADVTSPRLVDASPTNVINAHGIPRKWAILDISQTTTTEGGEQLGAVYLGEKALPQRRGSLSLTGGARHVTRGVRPTWAPRAGQWTRVSDHPADVPRKMIETSYDASTDTLNATLDNTSQKLDAIFERVGASLVGVL